MNGKSKEVGDNIKILGLEKKQKAFGEPIILVKKQTEGAYCIKPTCVKGLVNFSVWR